MPTFNNFKDTLYLQKDNVYASVSFDGGHFQLKQSGTKADIDGTVPPAQPDNGTPTTPTQPATTVDQYKKWPLVFEDEFTGTQLDTKKWTTGMPWGSPNNGANGELQMYDDSAVSVKNGTLELANIKPAKPVTHWSTGSMKFNYIGGMVTTYKTFNFQYGYMEIKASMPVGKGLWPAFWLLGYNADGTPGKWPFEVDIMEQIGEKSKVYANRHYPDKNSPSGGSNDSQEITVDDVTKPHTYGCLWDKDKLVYYVDGKEVARITKNIPQEKLYILLNTAIGGSWPGSPDRSTPFPSAFKVEYCKVWKG